MPFGWISTVQRLPSIGSPAIKTAANCFLPLDYSDYSVSYHLTILHIVTLQRGADRTSKHQTRALPDKARQIQQRCSMWCWIAIHLLITFGSRDTEYLYLYLYLCLCFSTEWSECVTAVQLVTRLPGGNQIQSTIHNTIQSEPDTIAAQKWVATS